MTTTCPTPHKRKLTKAQAKQEVLVLRRKLNSNTLRAYACPGGGHHHLGNSLPRMHQRAQVRRR